MAAATCSTNYLSGLCMFVGCRWLGHFANVSSSGPAQTNQIVVIGRASIWHPFLSFAVFLACSCATSAHPHCNCLGRQGRKVHEITALFKVLLVHDHGFACSGVQCERSKRASGGEMCWWDAFQTKRSCRLPLQRLKPTRTEEDQISRRHTPRH